MRRTCITGISMLLLAAVLLVPAVVSADDDENVEYQERTEISFDDDTISGDLTRPDGEYVEARKRVRHSNLIRIRENFRDHVLQSVGEL